MINTVEDLGPMPEILRALNMMEEYMDELDVSRIDIYQTLVDEEA